MEQNDKCKRIIYNLLDKMFDLEDAGTAEINEKYGQKVDPEKKKEFIRKIDNDLAQLYINYSDGFMIEWIADDDKDIRGRMHILSLKDLFYDRKGTFFDDNDIKEKNDICYFKPLDLITDEAECGIYINPDDTEFNNKCIYYHDSSDLGIFNLDLDFLGYVEMAFEARIFFYWPRVLLDIQNKKEGYVTKKFKEEMPKLFPDFNWEGFVEKYKSLRLSKK